MMRIMRRNRAAKAARRRQGKRLWWSACGSNVQRQPSTSTHFEIIKTKKIRRVRQVKKRRTSEIKVFLAGGNATFDNLVVDGSRISLRGLLVLCWVFALGAFVDGSEQAVNATSIEILRTEHLLYSFLRPLEIALDLFCGFHAIGKIGLNSGKSRARQFLQLKQLAVLCVQLAGSVCFFSH